MMSKIMINNYRLTNPCITALGFTCQRTMANNPYAPLAGIRTLA